MTWQYHTDISRLEAAVDVIANLWPLCITCEVLEPAAASIAPEFGREKARRQVRMQENDKVDPALVVGSVLRRTRSSIVATPSAQLILAKDASAHEGRIDMNI